MGLSRQLSTCKAEIIMRERNIKMAAVSSAEIENMIKERKENGKELITHQSVGKMYVLTFYYTGFLYCGSLGS